MLNYTKISRFVNNKPVFALILDEEPFLILADHHEIRKISTDGSNYTLLKQVRHFQNSIAFNVVPPDMH